MKLEDVNLGKQTQQQFGRSQLTSLIAILFCLIISIAREVFFLIRDGHENENIILSLMVTMFSIIILYPLIVITAIQLISGCKKTMLACK
jgi:hypothetical protein